MTDLKVGDYITVLSKDKNVPHNVEGYARILNTISYEIITSLHPHIRRIVR